MTTWLDSLINLIFPPKDPSTARLSHRQRWTFLLWLIVFLGLIFLFASQSQQAFSHPGGLDKQGCHTNRKTGEYHCHQESAVSSPKGSPSPVLPQHTESEPAQVFVMKVIDGDTIELSNGEKIRLIGVDTPETKHPTKPVQYFGKEATAFTKKMAEGKQVKLEYDWQRTDKYGRTLAYVYLLDGTFLNAEIIKQGYGFAYTKFPFKYLEEFRQYEREAREQKRGLWAEE